MAICLVLQHQVSPILYFGIKFGAMQVVQLQGFFLKLKREQKVATSMLRDEH